MKPQFEESQFAVFFVDDLTHRTLGRNVVLAPIGQVLEAKLGFDLGAWVPPGHPLWGPLGTVPLPGMSRPGWNPALSPRAAVTSKAINVFFQFKRSDYLLRPYARYFSDFGGPYWRFRVDRTLNVGSLPQHDLLEALEARTAGAALVRYVAPICHLYDELEAHCDSRTLLEQCVYVAPSRFAPAHTTCIFTSPANAMVNPDPESVKVDSWTQLQGRIADMVADAVDIEELLERTLELAYSLGARQPSELRYPWRLPQALPSEVRSVLELYLPAMDLMFRARLNWLVALVPEAG